VVEQGDGPRSPKLAQADRERARLMVSKRIKDVIARIRRAHPELARHLAARIRTGHTCIYVADDGNPSEWLI